MRPDYTHERGVEKAYRGRQLLELLQNSDDAGKDHPRPARFLLRLTGDFLVAANDGAPFSPAGIESLVISDRSPKQLERGRYIGQKGLGFRSLLSWSERPLVRSGEHLVAFDPEHARRVAAEIASEVPELEADIRRYAENHPSVPVPVMRFPFVPVDTDERALVADQVHGEGYETVIVLPLPQGTKREAVVADIVRQAEGVGAAALLFSRHLNEVRIEAGDVTATWLVERQVDSTSQTVVLQRETAISLWTIYRKEFDVPRELLDEEDGPAVVGLAVAVPQQARGGSSNSLCVFFPTSVVLPASVLAHATLETDDSRKRLIEGPTTRFALGQLAEFLAEVCENEVEISASPWRGLELLAGAERCDPELTSLGFRDALVEAVRSRRLLPLVAGSMASASEAWLAPDTIWSEEASAEWLGVLLAEPPSEAIDALVRSLKLRVLPAEEQTTRLEARISYDIGRGRFDDAGRLVGRLLGAKALPKAPLARILVDDGGSQLGKDDHVLLPPEGPAVRRPEWATNIHFLHDSYANAIRSAAGLNARELRNRLSEVGYQVDEYQLDAVVRRLVRSAETAAAVSPADEIERHLDVLRCVFEMVQHQEVVGTVTAPVRVLTEAGRLRRASECYIGREYPSGRLLTALYEPLGEDEFCAGPEALGIQGSTEQVELFLNRLGVSTRVRLKPIDRPYLVREAGLEQHVRETLARVAYPHEFAERRFDSAEEAFSALMIDYGDYQLPDRWAKVLQKGSPEAIVAFVAAQGLQHLDIRRPTGIVLRARYGQQSNHRHLRTVSVSDPMIYLLREQPWVPGNDGQRHQPRKIALSRSVRRVLGMAFHADAIDDRSPLLEPVGGATAVRTVLAAAGAIQSLDALQGDDLYALLLELPAQDPDGQVATSVYRSLVEAGQLDIESPRQEEFFQHGLMWGRLGDTEGYFEVSRLRYAPRTSVPEPIRQHVPLVAVDPRRSATEVARVFGVQALSPDEYEIEVDEEETERAPWSAQAASQLRTAVPFLYALRLSQRADERGEERRAFGDLELVVASRLVATVRLEARDPQPVVIDQDLKGLVTNRRLYLVSVLLAPGADPVFWRAVADLVADAINVPRVGGDFNSLLTCGDDHQRLRLLDHMTGGHAKALLEQARQALQIEDSDEDDSRQVLPPKSRPVREPASQRPSAEPTPARATPTPPAAADDPAPPTPVAPPSPPAGGRREWVVAGPAGAARGKGDTVSAMPEEETLLVAERFEALASPPRFTLRVSHLRGYEAFGCDILSFADEARRDRASAEQSVAIGDIERFIEVKGRASRSAPVELTDNERSAAVRYGPKYFIYRVYADPSRPGFHELAILKDPVSSPGQRAETRYSYSLAAHSGAEWFRMRSASDAGAHSVVAFNSEPESAPDPASEGLGDGNS